jgi:hypothetical protein
LHGNHRNRTVEVDKSGSTWQLLKIKVQIEKPAEFYAKWAFQKSLWVFQELRV